MATMRANVNGIDSLVPDDGLIFKRHRRNGAASSSRYASKPVSDVTTDLEIGASAGGRIRI